jgi:hypothetical protein
VQARPDRALVRTQDQPDRKANMAGIIGHLIS